MSAVLEHFATALLDPAQPVPAGVRSPRQTADSKRFAVYRNNVFVSLVGALEKRFPVTRRLVGDEFFRGMARSYAGDVRPSSPLLFHYGDSFPEFIRQFPPAAALAYLGDVARLETLWSDAYHAADHAPLPLATLATLPPERVGALRFVPHPATRLLRSDFPVGSIWAAHQGESVGPLRSSAAEAVLIVRPAAEVQVHILPAADAGFAEALLAGESVMEAALEGAAGFDPGRALVGLASLGAFSAIDATGEGPDDVQ